MPQDGTQLADASASPGTDLSSTMLPMMMMGNYGQGSLGSFGLGGMGTSVMDPGIYGAMARQRYAQSLMQQGMQATPVRSPWQAVARGVQGLLGGWEQSRAEQMMGEAGTRMQAQANDAWQRVQATINEGLGGLGRGGQGAPGAGPGGPGGPGAQAQPAEPGAFEGAILRHEGYGAPGNKGGPEGWGGFRPETWQAYVNANPAVFQGKTPDQILAMRNDPSVVSNAVSWLAQQNAPVLARNNVPVNGQTLGLAHFLGGQGASWIMNSPDNTPVRDVLTTNLGAQRAQAWIAANPQLGSQTVGQLKQSYGGFPNPAFIGATTTGPGGGPGGPGGAPGGGPPPGSGYATAIKLQMLGAQMAQNVTNPYMAAMGRYVMQMAPMFAKINEYGPPQPGPAPGTWVNRSAVTGRQDLGGQQLSPESYFARDFSTLQQLTAKANGNFGALSPQEQQAYNEAWARQSHLITDPATKRQTMTSPDMVVPGLLTPPGYSSGAGGGPGGPAGGTRPIGQAGTAVEQTAVQAQSQLDAAGKAQTAAYENARDAMASNQAIRSLSTQTTPGVLSPITMPAANIMQAFGISSDRIRALTGQDPTAAQVTAKQLFTLLGEKINQQGNIRAQALWARFEKALPSMESTAGTIDAVTRMYDAAVTMERQYADDRVNYVSGMGRKFRLSQNPADWDEKGLAEFDKNWMSQSQNDPRVWNAAALAATSMIRQQRGEKVTNPDAWRIGLTKAQQDMAEQRAAQLWPSELQYTPPTGGGQ